MRVIDVGTLNSILPEESSALVVYETEIKRKIVLSQNHVTQNTLTVVNDADVTHNFRRHFSGWM